MGHADSYNINLVYSYESYQRRTVVVAIDLPQGDYSKSATISRFWVEIAVTSALNREFVADRDHICPLYNDNNVGNLVFISLTECDPESIVSPAAPPGTHSEDLWNTQVD